MTDDTFNEKPVSIGELARRTGLSVRTIRFYCDEGVLESQRSTGGHRMFDPGTAVERLLLIRRLRTLGLGLAAITAVLHEQLSLGEAIAAESADLEIEFRSLAWRRASLRAVGTAAPEDRAARLSLLAAVENGHAAHDHLLHFWRGILTPLTRRDFDAFRCGNIPEPPVAPSVTEVVSYAELTALVTDPGLSRAMEQQLWRSDPQLIRDRRALFFDVGCTLVEVLPYVATDARPCAGAELDQFVEAHARARGERDSEEFRAHLLAGASDGDCRIQRYWRLTAELFGTSATVGQAHHWLYEALAYTAG